VDELTSPVRRKTPCCRNLLKHLCECRKADCPWLQHLRGQVDGAGHRHRHGHAKAQVKVAAEHGVHQPGTLRSKVSGEQRAHSCSRQLLLLQVPRDQLALLQGLGRVRGH
jgi:hypothetical protein